MEANQEANSTRGPSRGGVCECVYVLHVCQCVYVRCVFPAQMLGVAVLSSESVAITLMNGTCS